MVSSLEMFGSTIMMAEEATEITAVLGKFPTALNFVLPHKNGITRKVQP
jgi:hypothetical protein